MLYEWVDSDFWILRLAHEVVFRRQPDHLREKIAGIYGKATFFWGVLQLKYARGQKIRGSMGESV